MSSNMLIALKLTAPHLVEDDKECYHKETASHVIGSASHHCFTSGDVQGDENNR
jgi:hypothetical protein